MLNIENDKNYLNIVEYILDDSEFDKMSKIRHHCSNRYEHSLKVSYYSYKIAKALKLNYEEVARAGLLHDFYFESTLDYKKASDKVMLFTTGHPMQALKNAENRFELSEKEKDIIKTHMFPLDFRLPRYMESWVVNMVDTFLSTFEFTKKFSYKFSYVINLYLLVIFNSIK
ncbi:MAG: HD domain-containing protein [Ignavibacteriales bacterium]